MGVADETSDFTRKAPSLECGRTGYSSKAPGVNTKVMKAKDKGTKSSVIFKILCELRVNPGLYHCFTAKVKFASALCFGPTVIFCVCSPSFSWTAAIVYSPGGRPLISKFPSASLIA